MVATNGMMRCLLSGIDRLSINPSFRIIKIEMAGNMNVLIKTIAMTTPAGIPAKENGLEYNRKSTIQVGIASG